MKRYLKLIFGAVLLFLAVMLFFVLVLQSKETTKNVVALFATLSSGKTYDATYFAGVLIVDLMILAAIYFSFNWGYKLFTKNLRHRQSHEN